tara:strand:+ start:1222 stop:1413 length:192 start_codon:yes stop_codon:yes gene_type:complete
MINEEKNIIEIETYYGTLDNGEIIYDTDSIREDYEKDMKEIQKHNSNSFDKTYSGVCISTKNK